MSASARPGMGPLAGLAAALSACQSDGLVVAACDMPCFDQAAAEFLASFADQGWPAGEHRVGQLFQSVGGQAISLEGTSLPDAVVCNVNTPEELKELLQS